MVSTRGNRDQKISFYFIFIVDHFIYCQERNEETKSRSSIHPAL